MAFFIAIEGIDGAGKTTQVQLLAQRLKKSCGLPLLVLHEPGSTALGERLRSLIKGATDVPVVPHAELLLLAAARAQLVEERIKPFLALDSIVLCDRFSGSTLAYQGYGRGLDLALVRQAETIATGGLTPDRVILLDVEVKTALFRKRDMLRLDRFEREDLEFYEKVRKGYLELGQASPEVWKIVDGSQSPESVAAAVWQEVAPLVLGGNNG